MENVQEILAQPTPWGLTVMQTGLVFIVAAGLVVLWTALRFLLQFGMVIFQIGCALVLVLICGLATFMVIYNFALASP